MGSGNGYSVGCTAFRDEQDDEYSFTKHSAWQIWYLEPRLLCIPLLTGEMKTTY